MDDQDGSGTDQITVDISEFGEIHTTDYDLPPATQYEGEVIVRELSGEAFIADDGEWVRHESLCRLFRKVK